MTRRTKAEIEKMKQTQKKNFSAYFPPELLEKLKNEAEKERRSVNGQLCYILEKHFENQ